MPIEISFKFLFSAMEKVSYMADNDIKISLINCKRIYSIMSFKSKKNKYLRRIAKFISSYDTDGIGKNEFSDMAVFLKNKKPIIFDVGLILVKVFLNFERNFRGATFILLSHLSPHLKSFQKTLIM